MMYYKNGNITQPRLPISNPTEKQILEAGYKKYSTERPAYDPETHKLVKGELVETETEVVQHYVAVALTPEDIEAVRENVQSAKWRIKIILKRSNEWQSLIDAVQTMPEEIQIAFNETAVITRNSNAVELLRKVLKKTPEQVDEIFRKANEIDI